MKGLLHVFIFTLLVYKISGTCNRKYPFWDFLFSFDWIKKPLDFLQYGDSTFVCVCTKKECGKLPIVENPNNGEFDIYSSSKNDLRLEKSSHKMIKVNKFIDSVITIKEKKRQKIIGFGGAFTDAFGEQLANISKELSDKLLEAYFSPSGLQYNLCRTPIGGSDFSSRPYSYADEVENDVNLDNFALQNEDYMLKIPFIKKAISLNNDLLMFASPWSPPKWMKTNAEFNGNGRLKTSFSQTWANYFIKYLELYEQNDINFWGITAQNEPFFGGVLWQHPWNQCAYLPSELTTFIKDFLGPTLAMSKYNATKLMHFDDNRVVLPFYIDLFDDTNANSFVNGIGLHWYLDFPPFSWLVPLSYIDDVYEKYNFKDQDKFILNTEACSGWLFSPTKLGNWRRGEMYVESIINYLNHYSSGWVDWNMALDLTGGPNWADNPTDSPIKVNKEKDEFYQQPMYFAMGHFSKFISRDDLVLEVAVENCILDFTNIITPIIATATINPQGRISVVVLNRKHREQTILIKSVTKEFTVKLSPRSFHTILFS